MTRKARNRLAANLKRIRKARGMTQADLKERAGTTSVAMIEAGRRLEPTYETLRRIAQALGVSVEELHGRK